ncbi:MAG: hypothetical protein A3G52_02695 [Candidatus Taylorbacteria bacterium RIFCSPLOWO2_12_FULL_43_20]|uniref:BrnT family toxin n=1 Tax=Candidatus Taylorbacteria bacterium RIFCSPLOWO2_12_FULL_43_20 TaxID=1802332 RepID=A0A1G2NZP9_9BACT|nr:MAG: hypothetical protein A3B98_03190 [Candidatus Taylorbacteria bacterium RIFCSPHIGHO2_02_FULL_43_55]OHA28109.1 MAG: hypothetical protein A3E92_00180 [Candidatus Taylorbacteria bacterium RIFCSPHIGHO2_12_FULL_42_34]OHA32322.1 MAG: hypothetical protein A3B09_03100 [Candidatus Taylorbacteria bacterium RIFCSPLOWO2_01_FULL_43_83]OHA37659.1 MAG: hypothetical protein A3H58_03220 [Candidatus Taylorbacteria bacterium RIFCSPLOWO2_02_FULL_43_22b]OHA41550.1 MAG: hypothetical protein A3G52_02695 [Candid
MKDVVGFEWDAGNSGKNWKSHAVTDEECEEAFFDPDKKVAVDETHSQNERRYFLLGNTSQSRLLVIVFTIRHERIRVISARDINKKERKLYEKEY